MKKDISFILNGTQVTVPASGHTRLIDALRGPLKQTGTKEACGEGECGACTVIVDGKTVSSCIHPVFEVEGKSVTTIEGLVEKGNKLSPIAQAFVDNGAVQCGYCTPGMIMSTKVLLDSNTDPSEMEIRTALQGNLCRCTGYVQIVDSVKEAGKKIRGAS